MIRWLLAFLLCGVFAPFALAQTPGERLLAAAARGDLAGLHASLRAGAGVDSRDSQRRTALLLATYFDHAEVARALIRAGADVNAKDAIEDSPFLYAGAEGRSEILKLTLAAGADLASTNRYGGTALIPAAHHGHVEAVRILLGTQINVNHINKLGWTALMEAVVLGDGGTAHSQIVHLLLDRGARADIPDREGMTPLAHARRRGQARIVALLEASGAR